jgi:hypothetical protein
MRPAVTDADEVAVTWEELKAAEKGRTRALRGDPASLPSLARGAKMLDRLERVRPARSSPAGRGRGGGRSLGPGAARRPGPGTLGRVDAEGSLRAALTRLSAQEAQVARPADGG